MSPVQRVAMGLVIVFLSAYFPADPSPEWAYYDALPDPVGWALVMWGIEGMRQHGTTIDLDVLRWLGWAALALSVPLWFPQVNHLVVPKFNPDIDISLLWAISLPQLAFSLLLVRQIGTAALREEPRDRYAATRFGLLTWAFALCIVLPVLAHGAGIEQLVDPSEIAIGASALALVYFLFRVHRRTWLGGPGPLEVTPYDPGNGESRPPS